MPLLLLEVIASVLIFLVLGLDFWDRVTLLDRRHGYSVGRFSDLYRIKIIYSTVCNIPVCIQHPVVGPLIRQYPCVDTTPRCGTTN